ncbi:hypothetical protein RHGRI_001058 [Rhododendron griersonianum]|uniref:Uncharacterized protein n=1 Tax=Rhododendron griersonianum TaxID=479676 RepID=A0AAV6LLN7_9ERIC|nr:hypothetical protein RHGRI_001058 [Rhododendron griersonianum]
MEQNVKKYVSVEMHPWVLNLQKTLESFVSRVWCVLFRGILREGSTQNHASNLPQFSSLFNFVQFAGCPHKNSWTQSISELQHLKSPLQLVATRFRWSILSNGYYEVLSIRWEMK